MKKKWIIFFTQVLEEIVKEVNGRLYIGRKGKIKINYFTSIIKTRKKLYEKYLELCTHEYDIDTCRKNMNMVLKTKLYYYARRKIEPIYTLVLNIYIHDSIDIEKLKNILSRVKLNDTSPNGG